MDKKQVIIEQLEKYNYRLTEFELLCVIDRVSKYRKKNLINFAKVINRLKPERPESLNFTYEFKF